MRAWASRVLSERPRLFLLSLTIAVALWFYAGSTVRPASEGSPTASLRLNNVEVTFTGVAEGLRASSSPDAVDIEMRWPAAVLLSVRPRDVQAVADLSGEDERLLFSERVAPVLPPKDLALGVGDELLGRAHLRRELGDALRVHLVVVDEPAAVGEARPRRDRALHRLGRRVGQAPGAGEDIELRHLCCLSVPLPRKRSPIV